jgi:replicative DNA helicase
MHIWRELRLPVLFVSMEMSKEQIIERCSAIHARMPLDEITYRRGRGLTRPALERLKQRLGALREDPVAFNVADTSMVQDIGQIHALARQLRPRVLFLDGGYLVGSEDRHLKFNQRIDQVSRALKREVASGLHIPVVVTWQVNREGSAGKLKKGQRVSMEHIAGSDAIVQDADLLCALTEDESPETILCRTVEVVKGRQGQRGQWKIHWDWERMEFGDYVEPKERALHVVSGDAGRDGSA